MERPESLDPELTEDHVIRPSPCAASTLLVAPLKESADPLVHEVVDGAIRHQPGAVVEVIRPSDQPLVQLCHDL